VGTRPVRWPRTVIARLVTRRDDARVASFVTAAAALFLLVVLADDAMHLGLVAPANAIYLTIAVAMAVAGVGPWLAWSRRSGRAVRLRCRSGLLETTGLRIDASDVHAISVAHAAQGSSVAIKHGKRVTFVEVERADDAARIAAALEAPHARTSDVVVLPRSRAIAVIQLVVSVAAVIAAPLYYLAATHGEFTAGIVPDAKAHFGIAGVVAAQLSFLFLIMRQLWPNQGVALGGRSAWEVHAALHRDRAAQVGASADDERERDAPGERVRIGALERGDEGVGAWLARIDAIPTEQHAYRGDALKKDVLWDALGDADAAVDTRMAAARVLRRRYGEEERALVRVVDDPDVRLRVEAALEDHEDAERRIERLGPLFRARRLL
jgi:hypothetical protein